MTRRQLLLATTVAAPLLAALRREDLVSATKLIQGQVDAGSLRAAVLEVRQGKGDSGIDRFHFGEAKSPDALFLLASITKPMTATAVMRLVDARQVSIDDPVEKFIPEFRGGARGRVLIRHLLTHSSGLPDMLPDNDGLRARHAPLSEYVTQTCTTPLLFSPGTQVKYQSMGILLAAEIVERVTKQPLPAYLQEHVFTPLRMTHTTLGLGSRKLSDTMQCQVTDHPDWNWNSPYWRNLASPWGGAHANAGDIATFLRYFAYPDARVLQPATAASMIVNQTSGLNTPWGFGWTLRGFGKGCSSQTFGHGGSTGTLAWHDPAKDLTFVLLTTKPTAESGKTLIAPVSDLISSQSHGVRPPAAPPAQGGAELGE